MSPCKCKKCTSGAPKASRPQPKQDAKVPAFQGDPTLGSLAGLCQQKPSPTKASLLRALVAAIEDAGVPDSGSAEHRAAQAEAMAMERAYETYVTTLEALITPDNTIKRITLKSAENEKHTIVVEFTMPKGAELQRATAFFNRALDDFSKGAPKDSADARDTKIKKRGARAATKKGKKS